MAFEGGGIRKREEDNEASYSLKALSDYVPRYYYGKRVIILLDEYDTPMQESHVNGYWDEMVFFTRGLFHASFKTNPYLERQIRMSHIFSGNKSPEPSFPERFRAKELSLNNFPYFLSFSPTALLKSQLHSPLCA